MRCLLTISLVIFSALSGFCQPNLYEGSWVIKEVRFSYIGGELSKEEAESLVGDTLSISQDSMEILGEFCMNVEFKSDTVDLRRYLYLEYRSNASVEQLGISAEEVEVFNLSCKSEDPESQYFDFSFIVLDQNHMILQWKKFLFLKRVHG